MLQPGRSPETPASIGRGCALGTAESLQREASGYGGSRLGGPSQGPRSSQRRGSRGRAPTREALCGPGGQGIWVAGGVWGRGGPGKCHGAAGRSQVSLGRQVCDVARFVGKASTGHGLWGRRPEPLEYCGVPVGGAPQDRRVQDHFTCFENLKNQCRVWSPCCLWSRVGSSQGTAVPGEVWRDSVSHRSNSPYSSSSGSREPREGLRGGRSPYSGNFSRPQIARGALSLGCHNSWEKPGDLCVTRGIEARCHGPQVRTGARGRRSHLLMGRWRQEQPVPWCTAGQVQGRWEH